MTLPNQKQNQCSPLQSPITTLVEPNLVVEPLKDKKRKPEGIKIKIKTNLAKAFITNTPAPASLVPPPAISLPSASKSTPKPTTNAKSTKSAVAPVTRATRRSTRQNQNSECKTATLTAMKTTSPQPGSEHYELYRTLAASPDRDFDSQSSILGSGVSSNFVAEVPEDSQVIRSRGSSDVTSDQDTSQNSSLVAPPSEIDLRLAAMMDGDPEPMAVEHAPVTLTNDCLDEIPHEKSVSPVLRRSPSPIPSPETPTTISTAPIEGRITRNKNGLTQVSLLYVLFKGAELKFRLVFFSQKKSEVSVRPQVTRSYERKRKLTVIEKSVESEPTPTIDPSIPTIDRTLLTNDIPMGNNEITLALPPLIEHDIIKATSSDEFEHVANDIQITPKYKYNKRPRRTCNVQPSEERSETMVNDDNVQENSDVMLTRNLNNININSEAINKNENNNMDTCGGDDGTIEKPSVKLVISKKKGSIFKSRAIDVEEGNT